MTSVRRFALPLTQSSTDDRSSSSSAPGSTLGIQDLADNGGYVLVRASCEKEHMNDMTNPPLFRLVHWIRPVWPSTKAVVRRTDDLLEMHRDLLGLIFLSAVTDILYDARGAQRFVCPFSQYLIDLRWTIVYNTDTVDQRQIWVHMRSSALVVLVTRYWTCLPRIVGTDSTPTFEKDPRQRFLKWCAL